MKCPVCDASMRIIEKYGVEIDICPDCKGVWLDRGEIEKIISLHAAGGPAPARSEMPREAPRYAEEPRHHDDRRDYPSHEQGNNQYRKPHKKRESWFGEIFDMFGD